MDRLEHFEHLEHFAGVKTGDTDPTSRMSPAPPAADVAGASQFVDRRPEILSGWVVKRISGAVLYCPRILRPFSSHMAKPEAAELSLDVGPYLHNEHYGPLEPRLTLRPRWSH